MRLQILDVYGIGPEMADPILLYAGNKPVFVIDAYTRRIISRLGLAPEKDTYDAYQKLFMERLPLSLELFNEYHALLVRHGKSVRRKPPVYGNCCLREICRFPTMDERVQEQR